MNRLLHWLVVAYSRFLNLYPRKFRGEFAAEMRTVFRSAVMDAAEAGRLPLAIVCGREFIGLPFNILKEFWYELQGEEAIMRGTWGEAFWAGLPHLLIAILVLATGALANTGLATVSGIFLGLLLLLGLLATVYYTWRNHWPAWSASWYGYAGLIVFIFAILPPQGWNPPLDRIFRGIGSLLLGLLSLVTLMYWLTRRNAIEGLLMGMPLMILYWFPITEFIPNQIRFWLTFGIFLLGALTATLITRINNIQRAIWIVLGASVLSRLPIAYARTYWHNIPRGHFSPPSVGQMIDLFSVQFLAGAALALGPIVGWGVWKLGQRYRQAGRIGASLILLGALVNLLGQFSYWRSLNHLGLFGALGISFLFSPDQLLSTLIARAGLIGIWVGVILLAVRTWQDNRLLSFAIIFVPLLLPLFAMFPVYFGYHMVPPGLSFEFSSLSEGYRYLIFLCGAAWLVMSGWTIARLHANPSTLQGAV